MSNQRFSSGPVIVGYLAAVKVALHMATATVYGFFIDELYFLACGEHLAWGYVDMPPLTAFQAWLTRHLFGDSPWSIRLFPALLGAGFVLLAGALARAMGGGRFAQAMAALAVLLAPISLGICSYLSMNSVEPVLWTACALLVARMIETGDTRLWVPFGVIAGIGLLNKHTMALFGLAVVAGLVLTPERRLLWSRWLLLGGAIAFAIFLPNLVWMAQHHFPMLELLANIKADGRDVSMGLGQFLATEVLFLGPGALPLWVGGLLALLLAGAQRRFRALGFAWLVTFGVLAATSGSHKTYYIAPAAGVLFAAGAVAAEQRLRATSARAAFLALVTVVGVAVAPLALPVLPPEAFLRYTAAIHLEQPRLEHRRTQALPQFFADRMGWEDMVDTVARVYDALPAEERARTAIFANDYGQGGAIDYYGPRLGLPKAVGGHLTYWYWGPREYTGDTMIVLGDSLEGASHWFESVTEVARVGHPMAMDQEQFPVLLCRRPKLGNLPTMWPRLKHWD